MKRSAARPNEYWQERLKFDKDREALFFAEHEGQLAGMTGIFRGLVKEKPPRIRPFGECTSRPQWRGRHISETLVRSCLGWAKEQGLVIVKLAVVTTNRPAIRCYERCGFTIYGKEPKALFYDGVYYDEYLMSIEVDLRFDPTTDFIGD